MSRGEVNTDRQISSLLYPSACFYVINTNHTIKIKAGVIRSLTFAHSFINDSVVASMLAGFDTHNENSMLESVKPRNTILYVCAELSNTLEEI